MRKTVLFVCILILTCASACRSNAPAETTMPHETSGTIETPVPSINFVTPLNGETLDYAGLYFQIEPVPGAEGYSWTFIQNDNILWDTIQNEQKITGVEYGIPATGGLNEKFLQGEFSVQVKARINGEWTEPATITLYLPPRELVPTVQPIPTPTKTPALESVSNYRVVWEKLPPVSGLPVRGMQATYDSNRNVTVLFGGTSSANRFLNETWEYDGVNWKSINTQHAPIPRIWFGMTYDSKRKVVVLFGGRQNDSGALLNDTWEYNGRDWKQINPATVPGKRGDGSGMVYDTCRNKIILFGGKAENDAATQTWEYDGATWTQLTTAKSPPARELTAMAFDTKRCKAILFGGGHNGQVLNDTWEYSGANWEKINPEQTPLGRWGHAMAYNPLVGTVVLFGGFTTTNTLLRDTWLYTETGWQKVLSPLTPSAREQQALLFNDDTGQIMLFGGYGSDGNWTLTESLLPPKPDINCALGFTRLAIGDYAQPAGAVTLANRIRSEPAIGDNIIAGFTPGMFIKIIDGPVCADGFVFWKVESRFITGGVGWTAEGDGINYFLEPLK